MKLGKLPARPGAVKLKFRGIMTYMANNLTNKRFGKLTALHTTGSDKFKRRLWYCQCDCGNTKIIRSISLVNGTTQSCGCIHREMMIKRNYKHGHKSRSKQHELYSTWLSMRVRCMNPKVESFKNYGGRGIRICERWNNFELFIKDVGNRPKGKTLDRIDNDGNYEPGNVRWATAKEQVQNSRRVSHAV